MTNEEFELECDRLGQLTSKLEHYESMLNEVYPGDWDYDFYVTQVASLSILVGDLYKKLWAEVVARSPQD